MQEPPRDASSEDLWAGVEAVLGNWHAAHPDATLAEMEAAVEEQLTRLRTHLLQARLTAGTAEAAETERPRCPQCGTPLQRRGRRRRTLTGRGGGALHLDRPYYECPACGSGLFPPG
jgi:YgiT-type zinc finger domain-containing protein